MALASGAGPKEIPILASGSRVGPRGTGCIPGPMGIDTRESS